MLVGKLTGNAKAKKRDGNNDKEAHLDNLVVVPRLFLRRGLIASDQEKAKEGYMAEGAMAVILVVQKVRLYGYRLRGPMITASTSVLRQVGVGHFVIKILTYATVARTALGWTGNRLGRAIRQNEHSVQTQV